VIEDGEAWLSSIFKSPVSGRIQLASTNLDGDEQADLSVHGGPDKAVCVYSADHFADWRTVLAARELGPGAFGENFSVTGMSEQTVSIGDVFEVGTAVVQVSQPRGPCWKLGRRWGRLDLPRLVLRSGRTGWYFRVLSPGQVAADDPLVLTERQHADWSIARVNEIFYARDSERDPVARRALARCAALSESWRTALLRD
jgi:MOSC domain-containing protein YiiM